jgi:hypothetical protein
LVCTDYFRNCYQPEKDSKVAKISLVEHNALIQAIEMGIPRDELKKRFGFKSLGALKVAYLNGLIALGKVAAIHTIRKEKRVDNKVRINSRGSLVIPKALIDSLGLSKSELFKVEKAGDGLALQPAKKAPKTILKKKRPTVD